MREMIAKSQLATGAEFIGAVHVGTRPAAGRKCQRITSQRASSPDKQRVLIRDARCVNLLAPRMMTLALLPLIFGQKFSTQPTTTVCLRLPILPLSNFKFIRTGFDRFITRDKEKHAIVDVLMRRALITNTHTPSMTPEAAEEFRHLQSARMSIAHVKHFRLSSAR